MNQHSLHPEQLALFSRIEMIISNSKWEDRELGVAVLQDLAESVPRLRREREQLKKKEALLRKAEIAYDPRSNGDANYRLRKAAKTLGWSMEGRGSKYNECAVLFDFYELHKVFYGMSPPVVDMKTWEGNHFLHDWGCLLSDRKPSRQEMLWKIIQTLTVCHGFQSEDACREYLKKRRVKPLPHSWPETSEK